ncbi:8325_t:CDS:2, partial [Scutellospora calospora]
GPEFDTLLKPLWAYPRVSITLLSRKLVTVTNQRRSYSNIKKFIMEQIEHPEVIIDSLPYIDQEIDYEGMRAKVDKLVEQEMKKRPSHSKKDYASHFPFNFELFKESSILATEYQRVQQGKAMVEMDTSRYKLIEPEDKEDEEAWKKAIDNSNAQLQHQNLRFFNLELLQKFGANAWKLHNFQLEHQLQQLQRLLEEYRQNILELNKQRKSSQVQAGSQIEALENKWTELIGQTLQLEVACASLESEIQQLKLYEQQLIAGTITKDNSVEKNEEQTEEESKEDTDQ